MWIPNKNVAKHFQAREVGILTDGNIFCFRRDRLDLSFIRVQYYVNGFIAARRTNDKITCMQQIHISYYGTVCL